jgi:hypothetical protein
MIKSGVSKRMLLKVSTANARAQKSAERFDPAIPVRIFLDQVADQYSDPKKGEISNHCGKECR